MRVPKAFVNQTEFRAEIARACRLLAPEVVEIVPELGNDWSGEPAVFFMIILADSATSRDRLLNVSNKVSQAIVQDVQPLERWDVLPYFSFRSKSEQENLNHLAPV